MAVSLRTTSFIVFRRRMGQASPKSSTASLSAGKDCFAPAASRTSYVTARPRTSERRRRPKGFSIPTTSQAWMHSRAPTRRGVMVTTNSSSPPGGIVPSGGETLTEHPTPSAEDSSHLYCAGSCVRFLCRTTRSTGTLT